MIVALVLASTISAQTRATHAAVPLAADGRPDLQGVWDNSALTPLERPADLADQEFFPDKAAAEYESLEQYVVRLQSRFGVPEGALTGEANGIWRARRSLGPDRRTSIIVDPPNGKLPPLTAFAAARAAELARMRKEHRADNPEELSINERCISWGADPPLIPVADNNNVQIVQTRDYVLLLLEMNHDARIVPMDGRPHLPSHLTTWLGDSRGRWEGNTLVIESTNFTSKVAAFSARLGASGFEFGSAEHLRLTERFTRIDSKTLQYEFTVNDASTFTKPFTGRLPMNLTDQMIYEYACHEGNYGLQNILRSGRAADQPGGALKR